MWLQVPCEVAVLPLPQGRRVFALGNTKQKLFTNNLGMLPPPHPQFGAQLERFIQIQSQFACVVSAGNMPNWAGHKGSVSLGEENRDRKKNAHSPLPVRPGLRETGQEAVLPGPSFRAVLSAPFSSFTPTEQPFKPRKHTNCFFLPNQKRPGTPFEVK